jgi:hypothetical protein
MNRTNDPRAVAGFGQVLVTLIDRLEPDQKEAAAAAASHKVLDAMAGTAEPRDLLELVRALDALAKQLSQEQKPRIAALAVGRLLDARARRPAVLVSMEALADQVTTGDLVNLLKYPTCVDGGRRTLLRELGRRLGPLPTPVSASAVTIAALQPCPLVSAAVASYIASLYPGGRVPFVDLWEAMDSLGVHHPEVDLSGPLLTAEH